MVVVRVTVSDAATPPFTRGGANFKPLTHPPLQWVIPVPTTFGRASAVLAVAGRTMRIKSNAAPVRIERLIMDAPKSVGVR
jgi:hypothetical protein